MTSHEYETILTELRSLRKRQNALLALVCVIVLWMTAITFAADVHVALADREQFAAHDWPFLYYVSLETLPEDRREETARVFAFAVCSLSSRQVIEEQLPVQIAPTVYRIDTRGLGWVTQLPKILAESYPYSRQEGVSSLVIRADWFIATLLDQTESDAYFRLLYGRQLKTLDEFLSLQQADSKSAHLLGHIEDTSRVSVQRTRLIKSIPTATRADVWQTLDFARLTPESDPLEHLDQNFQHDASEIIAAVPKTIAATGQLGILQTYALANAKGELQTKAPADIVTDFTNIRGVEIRSPLSCMACHAAGLQKLSTNSLRRYIQSGAEAYADDAARRKIEAFHLSNLQTLIERQNTDFAAIIHGINRFTPTENSAALQRVIRDYDQSLTLERAAAELLITPVDLQVLLSRGAVPARLAQLASEVPIGRTSWEEHYRPLLNSLD